MWLALLLLASFELAPAPGSRFTLEVAKTGLLSGKKHLFEFTAYRGVLRLDEQAPEKSRVELSIEAASAVCKDTWLSAKDLKKVQEWALHQMMDVNHHPRIVFTSERITPIDESRYEVEGPLVIRGIARPVRVRVTRDGETFTGTAEIRLKDYGLKPPSAALGTIGTKNEMRLEFQLKARNVS